MSHRKVAKLFGRALSSPFASSNRSFSRSRGRSLRSGSAAIARPAPVKVITIAALLLLALLSPLALGGVAYGSQGGTVCTKIEFNGKQPTTWTSDGHYVSVTVKAGQTVKTWNDVSPGQTLGPIIRESNGKPIEFSNLTKCVVKTPPTTTTTLPLETTTTAAPEVTTTTAAPEVTTTTAAPEVTTTTAAPEVTTTTAAPEVTTTTAAPEVTTTTRVPDDVTTTTLVPCRPGEERDEEGQCVSTSILVSVGCWIDGSLTVEIRNTRDATVRPRGIPVQWSFGGIGDEVVVPPLGTVDIVLTGGPTSGTFEVTWSGDQHRSTPVSDADCTPTTTTTVPDEETTTTAPEEETTTTVPEEETTTTAPESSTTLVPVETTTTVPGETTTTVTPEQTTTTEVVAVPAETTTTVVSQTVTPTPSGTSLPYTGGQYLQVLGLIGAMALLAGSGMVRLIGRKH